MAGESVITLQEIYATLLQREQLARQQLQQILDQNTAISTGLIDVANNQQHTEASIVLPLFMQALSEGLTPEQFAEKYPLFSQLDITQLLSQVLQERQIGSFVGNPIQGLLGNGRDENGEDLAEDVSLETLGSTQGETVDDVETYQDITWDEDYLPYREYLQEHGMIHTDDNRVQWVARANIEALLNVQNPGQLLSQVISIQLKGRNLQSKRQSEIIIEGMYLTGYKNTNRFFTLNDVYLILKTVKLDRLVKKKTDNQDLISSEVHVLTSGQLVQAHEVNIVQDLDIAVSITGEPTEELVTSSEWDQIKRSLQEYSISRKAIKLDEKPHDYVREADVIRVLQTDLPEQMRSNAVHYLELIKADNIKVRTGMDIYSESKYANHQFYRVSEVITSLEHIFFQSVEPEVLVGASSMSELISNLCAIPQLKEELGWLGTWISGSKIVLNSKHYFKWEKVKDLLSFEEKDVQLVDLIETDIMKYESTEELIELSDKSGLAISANLLLQVIKQVVEIGGRIQRPFSI